jgi:hypothetical protein
MRDGSYEFQRPDRGPVLSGRDQWRTLITETLHATLGAEPAAEEFYLPFFDGVKEIGWKFQALFQKKFGLELIRIEAEGPLKSPMRKLIFAHGDLLAYAHSFPSVV